MKECKEPDCGRVNYVRGYCKRHYEYYIARGARRPHARLEQVAMERAIAGPVRREDLSRQEARCVAWVLTQQGMSAHAIAARVHVSSRTVVRWRKAWREALQETK